MPRSSSETELASERHLRNASLIDQEAINRHPVAIVGVGAIGSHLAEMLVKLGVRELILIDFDDVDEVNLGVQGFYEADVGRSKVVAVSERLLSINSGVQVNALNEEYRPELIMSGSVIFCCVDSIKTRRRIFRDFRENNWTVFLDGRMAAESLRVFTIDRTAESLALYTESLFPSHQAHRESCTARSTIYCASMAAAILCAQYKKWAMEQSPQVHLQMDILCMDIFG